MSTEGKGITTGIDKGVGSSGTIDKSKERIKVLTTFRDNIVAFLDELIEQFPTEGDLIILRIFFKDQMPIVEVMNHFIQRILPLEDNIKKRDDKFFLSNNILFSALDDNKVNHFKKIWMSDVLDKEDRRVIWTWFDKFVAIAKKYQALV